jgi:SAM-dependent methyltransferase
MAKQGEIEYARRLGEVGLWHAVNKPFSDPLCPRYLMRIASVMELLPPPPARILDAGCGAGWTTEFLGRQGHVVVGVDIAPDMIARAERQRQKQQMPNISFRVSDYESLPFKEEFDAALFFDALHHAVDEEAALRAVYRALKPGGCCVTSEPGTGHSQTELSRSAIKEFDVTEKDMPPGKIIQLGRGIGFRTFRVYPHADEMGRVVYARRGGLAARSEWIRRLLGLLRLTRLYTLRPRSTGTVVLVK